jgi:thiosulfate dehydrogenase [quinone] large subunit
MDYDSKYIIFLLRISLGGLFFYDGLSKILIKTWSAAPLLEQAVLFPQVFAWFADPSRIKIVSLLNEWGLLLIGLGLILGLGVRVASGMGGLLMVLYYIMTLVFPITSGAGFLIDRHVIYLLVFALLFLSQAGYFWGLDGKLIVRFEN